MPKGIYKHKLKVPASHKIRYCKLPKRFDLRCVLTDEDIHNIRKYYKEGLTINQLKDLFEVSQNTIWWWLQPKKKRQEISWHKNQIPHKLNKKSKAINARRRKQIMRSQWLPYFRQLKTNNYRLRKKLPLVII